MQITEYVIDNRCDECIQSSAMTGYCCFCYCYYFMSPYAMNPYKLFELLILCYVILYGYSFSCIFLQLYESVAYPETHAMDDVITNAYLCRQFVSSI